MYYTRLTSPPVRPLTDLDPYIVLKHTSDAVLILDAEWRYRFVNHAAELLFRRHHATLLGRIHWEEYPTLLGTPAEQQLRTAVETQRQATFEQFLPGLYAWHSVSVVPNGPQTLLFIRDITDRVRALREEAVREGIRSVLEHVPVAITITRGREHRIDLQNAFSRAVLNGRNVEGSTVANALPEAASQGFIALLDGVFESKKLFQGQAMPLSYDRDGSGTIAKRYFDLTYQPIFATDGTVSGILHMGVDVTERHVERNRLSHYMAERDATLRQLSDGVILTDREGRITFVNDRAKEMHGVVRLDVSVDDYTTAYQLLTLDGEPYPPHELPLARAVLKNEFVQGASWRIRRPDRTELLVEGNAQPVFNEAGERIACVLVMHPL